MFRKVIFISELHFAETQGMGRKAIPIFHFDLLKQICGLITIT